MSDAPLIPDREALLRRATELGCVSAVGPLALQNYYAGRRVVARYMLEHRRPGSPRAAVAALLDDPRLWVDPPPADPVRGLRDDGVSQVLGHPVRTRWSTFFWIRTRPVANFLVGPGDAVVAQVPLQPAQVRVANVRPLIVFVGVVAVAAAVGLLVMPHPVYVVNGSPAPMVARVAGRVLEVPPHGTARAVVFGWNRPLSASVGEASLGEAYTPFSVHGIVYTPGLLTRLELRHVAYGSGRAAESEVLPAAEVQAVSADYFFETPPASMIVEDHHTEYRSYVIDLLADPEWPDVSSRVGYLAATEGPEAAWAWVQAQLRVEPDQFELAALVEPEDLAGRREFWSGLHERAPDSVPIWRRVGELDADRGAWLRALYTESELGTPGAALTLAFFTADPRESLALAATAARATNGVDRTLSLEAGADAAARQFNWSGAEKLWDKMLALDDGPATFARRERARVRRLGGLPHPEVDRVRLDDAARLTEEALEAAADAAALPRLLALADGHDDPAAARLALFLAVGDAVNARLTVNTMGLGEAVLLPSLRVEAGRTGDRGRLPRLLADVAPLDPAWTPVAAAIAEALQLPSAGGWAQAAADDPGGGPLLADIRARAATAPTPDAWVAWAPRWWPTASLAAAWLADADGRPADRDAWFGLAEAASVPGELLLARPAAPVTP